jgi:iron-sulfur cluster insertion protein
MSETQNITLTDTLVKKVKSLKEKENNSDLMLRVAVNGGGCSGFQYEFSFSESKEEDDNVFEKDGIMVLVDAVSLDFMKGATIDYKEDLQGSHFQIDNPNAQASCGCGTSFSV